MQSGQPWTPKTRQYRHARISQGRGFQAGKKDWNILGKIMLDSNNFKAWAAAMPWPLEPYKPKPTSRLCSKHFAREDFVVAKRATYRMNVKEWVSFSVPFFIWNVGVIKFHLETTIPIERRSHSMHFRSSSRASLSSTSESSSRKSPKSIRGRRQGFGFAGSAKKEEEDSKEGGRGQLQQIINQHL